MQATTDHIGVGSLVCRIGGHGVAQCGEVVRVDGDTVTLTSALSGREGEPQPIGKFYRLPDGEPLKRRAARAMAWASSRRQGAI